MTLTQITEKGIKDGEIVNADINASAAIAKSKLASLDVVNADINASAAIAGSKISPDFGSQNIVTTGKLGIGTTSLNSVFPLTIQAQYPGIQFLDAQGTDSFGFNADGNTFRIQKGVGGSGPTVLLEMATASSTFSNNLNANAGLDVSGAVTVSNDLTVDGDTLYVDSTNNRVGIETLTPNNTLDVHGGIVCSPNTDGKDTFELSTHAADEGRLKIKNVDTTTIQLRAGGASYLNGGNIGIGLTSPSTLLHLDSGSTPTTIKLDSDTEASIDFDDHGGSPKRYKIGTNISSNDGQFEIKDMTANAERIRIDSGGKTFVRTDTGGDSLAGIRSKANFGLDGSSIDYAHSCYEGQLTHNAGSSAKKGALLSGWDGTIQATAIGQNYDGTGYNLSLATNNNTSDRPTERLRVERTGNVKVLDGDLVIGAAGHGIDFSDTSQASGSSSEVLDDYEEGTWTPALQTTNNNYAGTQSTQDGIYIKVGRSVWVFGRINRGSVTGGSGNVQITGIPYGSNHGSQYESVVHFGYRTGVGYASLTGWISTSSDRLNLAYNDSNATYAVSVGALSAGSHWLYFSCHYFADS